MLQSWQAELAECEATIAAAERSFHEKGRALRRIKERPDGGAPLYRRAGYATWDDYVTRRWREWKKRHADQVIAAAEVMDRLGKILPILPAAESHAAALTALDPEDQPIVWARVVDEAPIDPATGQKIIVAKDVKGTVDAYRAERGAGATRVLDMGPAYSVEAWEALSDEERQQIVTEAPLGSDTRFNRTNDNVEWSLWTWNPVTGCRHDCDYCYARDIANHYYTDLPEGQRFEPFFRPSRLHAPRLMRVPSAYNPNDPTTIGEKNVFTGSMTDLFGKWVPQGWIDAVFAEVVNSPEWNYLFLTKFPQRLAEQRWPSNAWCGTTVDRQARVGTAERSFRGVTAGVKWLSCEPMLERLTFSDLSMFDWVVIGASSKSTQTDEFQPPWEWVEHLIGQARAAGCRVYVKPNLKTRPREYPGLHEEER
jgi:protein gp37